MKANYDTALGEIQALVPGYENSQWVKQLAAEDALLKAKARKRQILWNAATCPTNSNISWEVFVVLFCKQCKGKPVLLSRFSTLLVEGILQDICNRSNFSKYVAKPALTFPDADMMPANVTEGDVEDAFK